MICVVIKGPTYEEVRLQITHALLDADLVELRLDFFSSVTTNDLKQLQSDFKIPMIFTLRSQSQGGKYPESEKMRIDQLLSLALLKPDYLDLESHLPPEVVKEIAKQHPEIKLIISYHDFVTTPADLEGIYRQLQTFPAHLYKIAVTANNPIDAMRLLCWTKEKQAKNLITISMGPHGQISRILGPIVGSQITYATIDDGQQTAPGQLTAQELKEKYHHHSLNRQTAIYGLIGDPVKQSIGDVVHNAFMRASGLNAVYVLVQVASSELGEFLLWAKRLPFHGLSVTIPHKEHLLEYLDQIDPLAQNIGAANTVLFQDGKLSGFNTDAMGALNAIEEEILVKGKRIVILGAGGAAKAIIYEACRRGASVTVLNRDAEKAIKAGQRYGCVGMGLDRIGECCAEGYDILINCTPEAMPIDPKYILPQTYVMDITMRPIETAFLKQAKDKGCHLLYGYRMWVEQAVGQYGHWMKGRLNPHEIAQILDTSTRRLLA